MRHLLIIIILSTMAFQVKGQDSTEVKLEPWMVKMNFFPLSVNFEGRLGKSISIETGAGVNTGWRFNSDGQIKYTVYPNINLMLKNYYNLEKRFKKGKRTAMNSGNYWGLYSSFAFAPIADNFDNEYRWGLAVAPVWGFQRSYPCQITWGANLGYGVHINNMESGLGPVLNLHFGFILAK